MPQQLEPGSDRIVLNHGSSTIVISFGDLFMQNGLKVIPVSRHFFEIDVSESSLLGAVLSKFWQKHKRGTLAKYQKKLLTALDNKVYERAPATSHIPVGITPQSKPLSNLRHILAERFNVSELQDLCFDLGVVYEDLPGAGKVDKARELIAYLDRHSRILELVRTGEQVRPDIQWVQVFKGNKEVPLVERLYPLGTTALMEFEDHEFLFFAITWTEQKGHIPDDNCSTTNMWLALEKYWQEARKYALGKDINIPLIGSGITGVDLLPLHILELNFLSILSSISQRGKITTGEIRVILHPSIHSSIDLKLLEQLWKK